jgi:hypothetical protein
MKGRRALVEKTDSTLGFDRDRGRWVSVLVDDACVDLPLRLSHQTLLGCRALFLLHFCLLFVFSNRHVHRRTGWVPRDDVKRTEDGFDDMVDFFRDLRPVDAPVDFYFEVKGKVDGNSLTHSTYNTKQHVCNVQTSSTLWHKAVISTILMSRH